MGLGDDFVNSASRESLRIIGTVGEPINPEAWKWYHDVVGRKSVQSLIRGGKQKQVVFLSPDFWSNSIKTWSATLPFYGVKPSILDNEGNELKGACEGNLCIDNSWPGMMRTVIKIIKGLLIPTFLHLVENILLVMDVKEMMTDIFG